jgi:hypothetical protein
MIKLIRMCKHYAINECGAREGKDPLFCISAISRPTVMPAANGQRSVGKLQAMYVRIVPVAALSHIAHLV